MRFRDAGWGLLLVCAAALAQEPGDPASAPVELRPPMATPPEQPAPPAAAPPSVAEPVKRQDKPEPKPAADASDGNKAAVVKSGKAEASDEEEPPPKKAPKRFVPTEQGNADEEIPYPVDI